MPPPAAQPPPPNGNQPPAMGDDSQGDDGGGPDDSQGGDPNVQQNSGGLTEGQPILPGFNPDGYTYDPTGRRDPFTPFGANSGIQQLPGPSVPAALAPPNENSLTFFELSQLKVVAVVWDVKDPKAMVMDPKGKLHMVHKDSPIGRNNGFVYAIREGELVVVEPALTETGAQTAVSRVMYLNGK
jgi:type IV pilus assembly protein PilP